MFNVVWKPLIVASITDALLILLICIDRGNWRMALAPASLLIIAGYLQGRHISRVWRLIGWGWGRSCLRRDFWVEFTSDIIASLESFDVNGPCVIVVEIRSPGVTVDGIMSRTRTDQFPVRATVSRTEKRTSLAIGVPGNSPWIGGARFSLKHAAREIRSFQWRRVPRKPGELAKVRVRMQVYGRGVVRETPDVVKVDHRTMGFPVISLAK